MQIERLTSNIRKCYSSNCSNKANFHLKTINLDFCEPCFDKIQSLQKPKLIKYQFLVKRYKDSEFVLTREKYASLEEAKKDVYWALVIEPAIATKSETD